MAIIESAIASVTLAETVRYVRENKNKNSLQSVVDTAAKKTASDLEKETKNATGIDEASIHALIDTKDIEKLVEDSMREGERLADKNILQAVDCDILDQSIDCGDVVSEFVKYIEIEMIKQNVLGDVVEYSYLKQMLIRTDEVLSNQEEMKEMLISYIESDGAKFDIISDLNIPKLVDVLISRKDVKVRTATHPDLLSDEDVIETATENGCGIITRDRQFLTSQEPYRQLNKYQISQLDVVAHSRELPEEFSILLIGVDDGIKQKIRKALDELMHIYVTSGDIHNSYH
jgi:predicted nuclease of predicted toxin-antitoxin system